MKYLLTGAVIAAVGAAGAHAASAFSTDFDTDQSANFTSIVTGTVATPTWTYDYSTYVPTGLGSPSNEVATIVPAPNGPATTIGLRLDVNTGVGAGAAGAINVQTVQGFGGDTTLSVDMFGMHNGKAFGATGSTNYAVVGLMGDGATAAGSYGGTSGPGVTYDATWDGGSSIDFSGSVDSALQGTGYLATYGQNQTDTGWAALFPNAGVVDVGGDDVSGEVGVGAPGKQWVEWDVTYTAGTDTFDVSLDSTPVYSLSPTGVGVNFGRAILGDADRFSSVANPAGDQFLLFDNLSVSSATVPVELSVFSVN